VTDRRTPVNAAADRASDHLNSIAGLFKPGAKLTLLVRTPGNEEADFLLTNDDLGEAIKLIERRRVGARNG